MHKMNSEVKAIQWLVKQNTGKIPCSLFAKGAMLFFFVIFCAQKTHKVKIHIATVAPEFNHQGQNKSRQKTAKNSVQSISSLKITQGQNVPLKSNSIFSEIQQNKFYKIRAKYLNIIRWAEYFHLQEYLVCFKQPPLPKKKIKPKIHAFKLPIKYSIY